MGLNKFIIKFALGFGIKIGGIGPNGIFDFEAFLYRHLAVHKNMSFIF
ncbi:MAG TPA: hypothetical protein VNJ08_02910 [Bacteriovoracaceae bacterium]|nr:hypothetical protein [Bacteriovoracaceae bacterium]